MLLTSEENALVMRAWVEQKTIESNLVLTYICVVNICIAKISSLDSVLPCLDVS